MTLRNLLRRRRNVYGFDSKRIPKKVLLRVLVNATHVPSAGFTQDFDFVVVRNRMQNRKLAEAAHEHEYVRTGRARTGFISNAPVVIVPCGSKPRFEDKYGAPAEKNARLPWWLIDSGFASLALILSAFEEGLGASFIGAIDDRKVVDILRLPLDNSIVPLAIIPIGYASRDESSDWKRVRREIVRTRRRRLEEVVHWDTW